MSKRQKLNDQIQANIEKIKELKKKNVELTRETVLLCDEEQWFEERMEVTIKKEGRKKVKTERLIGRMHWVEQFKDEDSGEKFPIERSQVVRVDGKWDW